MYGFTARNMHYIVEQLDADRDGWPEGLGNVEREGMGEEKLDNAVYTIRGLTGPRRHGRRPRRRATERWARRHAPRPRAPLRGARGGCENVPGYADSLDDPGNNQLTSATGSASTPMEAELTGDGGAREPGLAAPDHAGRGAARCASSRATATTSASTTRARRAVTARPDGPTEKQTFTLNTSIIAVGEGNYGRLGPDQQQRFTTAQPPPAAARPRRAAGRDAGDRPPSPLDGRIVDQPFTGRAVGAAGLGRYGTAWPVVHQQLGVRPDLGRGRLEVVPQLPSDAPIAGRDIRLGDAAPSTSPRGAAATATGRRSRSRAGASRCGSATRCRPAPRSAR